MTLSLTAPETRTQTQFTQSNGKSSIYTHVICAIYACVYRYVCVAHVSAYVVQLVGRLTDTLLNFRFLAQAHMHTPSCRCEYIVDNFTVLWTDVAWQGTKCSHALLASICSAHEAPNVREIKFKRNGNNPSSGNYCVNTPTHAEQKGTKPNQTKRNGTEQNAEVYQRKPPKPKEGRGGRWKEAG